MTQMNYELAYYRQRMGGGGWLDHELDLDIALCSLIWGWPFNEIPIEYHVQN